MPLLVPVRTMRVVCDCWLLVLALIVIRDLIRVVIRGVIRGVIQ